MSQISPLNASENPNEVVDPAHQLFADLLSGSRKNEVPAEGEVVEGVVVELNKGEALIDFGGKAEGVIQGKELIDSSLDETIEVGKEILAVVLIPEDEEGRAVLSIRRARAERKWREMKQKFEDKTPVRISIVQPNKGGLIVNAEGLQGFVPISQLGPAHYPSNIQKGPGFADAAIAYLTQFIGEEFDAQIIEYERDTNRLILSERVLLQRTGGFEPLEELNFKVGDEIEGRVVAIKDFGIFVDLGTASGLVHISEMSWDRVNHPGDLVKMGQPLKVKVIGIDEGGRRVSLSMKQLSRNPWQELASKYDMGKVVKGVVTKIVDYGAFVQLEPGFDGLVHISELSSYHVKDPADVLQEGQEADFKIILLDKDNQRLGLSYRQANPEPLTGTAAEREAEAAKPAVESEAIDEAAPAAESAAVAPEQAPAEDPTPEPAEPEVKVDRDTAIADLKQLEGVGEETAKTLFESNYHSVKQIAEAELSELSLIPGVRRATAEKMKKSAEKLMSEA